MTEFQQNCRTTAVDDFLLSLSQLEKMLQENEDEKVNVYQKTEKQTNHQEKKLTSNSSGIDIAVWEEAVADIEQYLQNKTK